MNTKLFRFLSLSPLRQTRARGHTRSSAWLVWCVGSLLLTHIGVCPQFCFFGQGAPQKVQTNTDGTIVEVSPPHLHSLEREIGQADHLFSHAALRGWHEGDEVHPGRHHPQQPGRRQGATHHHIAPRLARTFWGRCDGCDFWADPVQSRRHHAGDQGGRCLPLLAPAALVAHEGTARRPRVRYEGAQGSFFSEVFTWWSPDRSTLMIRGR